MCLSLTAFNPNAAEPIAKVEAVPMNFRLEINDFFIYRGFLVLQSKLHLV
jgi:hypothetical protein